MTSSASQFHLSSSPERIARGGRVFTSNLHGIVSNDFPRIVAVMFPGNAAKLLARSIGAPLATVRWWLQRGLSPSRRRDVARALLLEMDRQDVARHSVRRVLVAWAGGNAGVAALVDSVVRDLPLAAADEGAAAEDDGAQGVLHFTPAVKLRA